MSEIIRIEDETVHKAETGTWTEEMTVMGSELFALLPKLVKEVTVRRIVVYKPNEEIFLNIPVVAGVAGMLLFGMWSGVALIAILAMRMRIVLEHQCIKEKSPEDIEPQLNS